MIPILPFLVVLAIPVLFVLLRLRLRKRRLPPGPPPTGILGDNKSQINPAAPHVTYFNWLKQYGQSSTGSFSVLNTNVNNTYYEIGPIISFHLGSSPKIGMSPFFSCSLSDKKVFWVISLGLSESSMGPVGEERGNLFRQTSFDHGVSSIQNSNRTYHQA